MNLFRTASPAVVKCCQLAFNFFVIRTSNFYKSLLHLKIAYVIYFHQPLVVN